MIVEISVLTNRKQGSLPWPGVGYPRLPNHANNCRPQERQDMRHNKDYDQLPEDPGYVSRTLLQLGSSTKGQYIVMGVYQ